MSVTIRVEGLKELSVRLKKLDSDVRRKELDNAGRAGARLIRDTAKLLAPTRSGLLHDAIIFRKQRDKSTTYSTTYAVGIGSKAWYAHFIEYGTAPHTIRAKRARVLAQRPTSFVVTRQTVGGVFGTVVEHPGTRAQPFLRPAWEGKKKVAVTAMRDVLRRRIMRG